jgi:O-antigen/teichoic acid export membrane protein/glycosyltransferase involved in cell wall biosynthesis
VKSKPPSSTIPETNPETSFLSDNDTFVKSVPLIENEFLRNGDEELGLSPRPHWPVSLLSSAVSILNTLLPLVLVRILTQDEVGHFRVFFLYLMAIPTLSLSNGLVNGLAFWSGQKEVKDQAIKASTSLLLLLALSSTLLMLAASPLLQSSLGWTSQETLLLCFAAFGSIAGTIFEEAAITSGHIWHGALFYAAFEIIRTGAIVTSALVFGDITSVLIAHTVISVLKVFVGYIIGKKLNICGLTFEPVIVKKLIAYALPVSFASILSLIVNYSDKFILATILSRGEYAIYSIGCLSFAPLIVVEHSITRVLIPQIASLFEANQQRAAATLYTTAVRHLGLFFIPAAFGFIVFADPIVRILYTENYLSSVPYLQLYALWYLSFLIPFDAVARARGDSKWPLVTFAKLAALSLLGTLISTYYFGSFGALFALLFSTFSLRIATLRYSLKNTEWTISDMLPYRAWGLMAIFCLIGGVIATALLPFFNSTVTWFLVVGGVGLAATALVGVIINRMESSSSNKVLMLVQSLQTGGIERMATQLSISLKKDSRYTPYVFAYDHRSNDVLAAQLRDNGVEVTTGEKAPGFSLRLLGSLIWFLYKNNIGIIHVHDIGGLIYGSFAKMFSLNKVHLVLTQHSFIHLEKVSRYRRYEKIFSRFPDKIAVVAEPLKKTYTELGADLEKIGYIPNGVSFKHRECIPSNELPDHRQALIPSVTAPLDTVWILYLARLYPQKGHNHALKVWSLLPSAIRQKSSLLLVGPEAEGNFQSEILGIINDTPDSNRIYLPGGTASPFSWIQASDIFLSCSEYEGMPLSCIEAAGCGLPVVLSKIPGHEFLADYAELFSLDSPEVGAKYLAGMIEEISSGLTDRTALWEKAAELRDLFSFERMHQRYIKLYNSLQR